MQNVGQFGQGAASVHPPSQFVSSEPSPTGGSTTSSLRQFRKKDIDKGHGESLPQHQKVLSESHVARVAPHNHFPPANDAYRYPASQFHSGYSPQMKYSDQIDASQPNPISTSVIQKPKTKDYMEMCNIQQQQQHLNNQQYSSDNGQYLHKDPTQNGYPNVFKPESQYYAKEQHHFQQMAHHPMPPKFNQMTNQNMRKFNPTPTDNPFLNKLSQLHPSIARSIMNDHHLQDTQSPYSVMDQRSMYGQQNPRFYPVHGPMHQPNPYPPNSNCPITPQHPYSNYSPAACNYSRSPQMAPVGARYPHMERSASPNRRVFSEGMHMQHMNTFHPMHQKMSSAPNYPQYRAPEYAQHYQHRRMPQDCYPSQSCRPRPAQFMQGHHQIPGQEMQELADSTVSPSDNLKKFIENWDEDDQATEMNNNIEGSLRENLREDAQGTVFMINPSDVQYIENNGISIVASENGFQLSSENYQYLNGTMVRIIDTNKEAPADTNTQDRVVNLQIMESSKSEGMVPCKQSKDDSKVVVHQNTVLNPLSERTQRSGPQMQNNINTSKELVDKNCSPISLDQLEQNLNYKQSETSHVPATLSEDLNQNSDDDGSYKSPKSMPLIDFFGEHAAVVGGEFSETPEDKSTGVILTPPVSCSNSDESLETSTQAVTDDNSEASVESGEVAPAERRKRIFSVDDIIGSSSKKELKEERMCGGDAVTEFLENETSFSSLELLQNCGAEHQERNREAAQKVLKVAGSSALVQVAGELMEITVKVVDGKKVINVKAFGSDAVTVVDCNQNYDVSCEGGVDNLNEITCKDDTVKTEAVKETVADVVVEKDILMASGESNKSPLGELVKEKTAENVKEDPRDEDREVAEKPNSEDSIKEADNGDVNDSVNIVKVTENSYDFEAEVSTGASAEDIKSVAAENCREAANEAVSETLADVEMVDIKDAVEESVQKDLVKHNEDVTGRDVEEAGEYVSCETEKSEKTFPAEREDNVAIAEENHSVEAESNKFEATPESQLAHLEKSPIEAARTDSLTATTEPTENIGEDEATTKLEGDFLELNEELSAVPPESDFLVKSEPFTELGQDSADAHVADISSEAAIQPKVFVHPHDNDISATVQESVVAHVEGNKLPLEPKVVQIDSFEESLTEDVATVLDSGEHENLKVECKIEHLSVDETQQEVEEEIGIVAVTKEKCEESSEIKSEQHFKEKTEAQVATCLREEVAKPSSEEHTTIEAPLDNLEEILSADILPTNQDTFNLILADSVETLQEIEEELGESSACTIVVQEPLIQEEEEEEEEIFSLEDEVFIEEPPAHEEIVADPLEGIGVIADRDLVCDSPEIPLGIANTYQPLNAPLEPVTTTHILEGPPRDKVLDKKTLKENEEHTKVAKLEVQILSPTSTNIEEGPATGKNAPHKKQMGDIDLSESTTTSVVATKAAKKLYEPDLQVQHDTVSSSKKEVGPKIRKSNLKRSKRLNEKGQMKSDQKEMLKVLAENRKRRRELTEKQQVNEKPQENVEQIKGQPEGDEDEYVDFKELLRARKLKKLRKQQEIVKEKAGKVAGTLLKSNGNSFREAKRPEKQNGSCCIGCGSAGAKKPKIAVKDDAKEDKSMSPDSKLEGVKKRVSFSDETTPSSTSCPVVAPPPSVLNPLHGMHPKDPRRRSKVFSNHVIAPSVSELMEENGTTPANKRKISLADYVSRKRKATTTESYESKKPQLLESSDQIMPKTVSDVKTSFLLNSSDWEDSNSPAPTPIPDKDHCLIQDFSGLIKTQKPVIDVNELVPLGNLRDKKLQEYKEHVDSQLNSLNIQIPKSKSQASRSTSSSDSDSLVKRFLNNEKLSKSEMDEIRRIIYYKKTMSQKNAKSPSENPTTYEVRGHSRVQNESNEVRMHLRKVNVKRKSCEESDSGSVTASSLRSECLNYKTNCGYSVINRLGDDGQPKIIFKRNKLDGVTDKQPVVELVKLDLDDLDKVKEKYNVTVRHSM